MSSPIQSVAIVGAGMAGISCALSLAVEIPNITLFECQAVPGGRMGVLREDGMQVDYGAQYFTAGRALFTQRIAEWQREWLVEPWQAWIVDLQQGRALSRPEHIDYYVARPGMDSLLKQLAALCPRIEYNITINQINRRKQRWQLIDSRGQDHGEYDAVIIALPPPHAAVLLQADDEMSALAANVQMNACWVLMLSFMQALQLGYDAAFVVDSPLSWIARDNSKPERPAAETWVLHANGEWSDHHQNNSSTQVSRSLFDAFKQATQADLKMPVSAKVHLWAHALPVNALHGDCLYNPALRLGACGDWCVSPRVEGAFLSGVAVAEKLLRS